MQFCACPLGSLDSFTFPTRFLNAWTLWSQPPCGVRVSWIPSNSPDEKRNIPPCKQRPTRLDSQTTLQAKGLGFVSCVCVLFGCVFGLFLSCFLRFWGGGGVCFCVWAHSPGWFWSGCDLHPLVLPHLISFHFLPSFPSSLLPTPQKMPITFFAFEHPYDPIQNLIFHFRLPNMHPKTACKHLTPVT